MKTLARSCLRKLFPVGLAFTVAFVSMQPVPGASVELLSARDSSTVLSAVGNGDSVMPSVSDDGRYVVFSSLASDLVTNDNGYWTLDVFLRDRASNTTVLLSANRFGTGGGNGHSTAVQISADGRYVIYQSVAGDLIEGDTNNVSDIFIHDSSTGTTRLVSVAADGGFGNGSSSDPVMTPDGRYVTFVSSASNLVADDTNGIPDVFVRDMVASTTTLVSVGATGAGSVMGTPVITPDGRYVAFFSTAKSMRTGPPWINLGEVYMRDLVLNRTTWVSTNAAITADALLHMGFMPSRHPAISEDGRFVAFKTGWTDGVLNMSLVPMALVLFRFDALSGTSAIISTNGFPEWANSEDVYGPEMTPDGRFVAYVEHEGPAGTINSSIRLWDGQTGSNVLVSADPDGSWPTNSTAYTPVLSPDGRYVTFVSDATNLVGNSISNGFHIFRRDVQSSITTLVDVDRNGIGSGDQRGAIPDVSADGRYVVYSARDGSLVAGDANRAFDVFLWDADTGTNQLLSMKDPLAGTLSGNSWSSFGPFRISADGAMTAFASMADDLVTNDFNGELDVFVRDLNAGSNILVSVGLDGNAGLGGSAHSPILSADGRYVVFVSGMTNLVAGDLNGAADVFRRDLWTSTTELVSADQTGASLGGYDPFSAISSANSRYVAFLCRTNVASAQTNIFWRDLTSGLTRLAADTAHPAREISMTTDGQRIAWFDNQSQLYVWDASVLANVYTNSTPSLASAVISPAGNQVLCQTSNQILICDVATGTSAAFYPSTVAIKSSGQWSFDGRYVVFVTASNLVPGDNNGTNDVYLDDLQTGTLTLVSVDQTGTASAAGASDSPAMSGDGRFVVFRTVATNVLPAVMNPPSLIGFDRLTGVRSLLVTGTVGSGGSSWAARPRLNSMGTKLAFQGWDSALVANDRNREGDIFGEDVSLLSLIDQDADGIPDWWLTQYFGHPDGQQGDLSRAQDDADGDGISNLAEFLAGTIPTNGDSVFAVQIQVGASEAGALLSWPVAPGRSYRVWFTQDLANPDWQASPGTIAVVGSVGYFPIETTNERQFFQVSCND